MKNIKSDGKNQNENMNEINALVAEIERKDNMIAELKKDAEKKKESYEWDKKYNWDRYHETSGKLEVAEKTIARMKKGLFSYFEVCFEDWRETRLKKKRIKKEVKERQKRYAELERKWEREKKQKEKENYKR